MKMFLDSADVDAIRRANDTALLDGVTTNPSMVAQTVKKFSQLIKEICSTVTGPVNVEAMGSTAQDLIENAQPLARLSPNIVVKIPMTVEGLTWIIHKPPERAGWRAGSKCFWRFALGIGLKEAFAAESGDTAPLPPIGFQAGGTPKRSEPTVIPKMLQLS